MKHLLSLLLLFLYPFFAISNGFAISGSVEGLQTGTATLAYINQEGDDTTLTVKITASKFIFTGQVLEPETARLTITEGWSYNLTFFLENSTIHINLVKDALEKLFDVKVDQVRTLIRTNKKSQGLAKRSRVAPKTVNEKIAYVTLAEGYSIDLFESIGAGTGVGEQVKAKAS